MAVSLAQFVRSILLTLSLCLSHWLTLISIDWVHIRANALIEPASKINKLMYSTSRRVAPRNKRYTHPCPNRTHHSSSAVEIHWICNRAIVHPSSSLALRAICDGNKIRRPFSPEYGHAQAQQPGPFPILRPVFFRCSNSDVGSLTIHWNPYHSMSALLHITYSAYNMYWCVYSLISVCVPQQLRTL